MDVERSALDLIRLVTGIGLHPAPNSVLENLYGNPRQAYQRPPSDRLHRYRKRHGNLQDRLSLFFGLTIQVQHDMNAFFTLCRP